MSQCSHRIASVAVAGLLAAGLSGSALAVDLDVVDSGFLTETGGSSKFDAVLAPAAAYNYSTGWELHYDGGGLKPAFPLVYQEKKSYFVFDLSGVAPGSIVDAELILPLPAGGYTSSDASEEFVLSATSLTSAELDILKDPMIMPPGPIPPGDIDPGLIMAAMDFFGVLTEVIDMMGPELGAAALEVGDAGTAVVIPLSPFGIDYLNDSAGGTVVIGGKVVSIDPMMPFYTQELFSGTAPFPESGMPPFSPTESPVLSLVAVPLPMGFPLLLSGFCALLVWQRRSAA